VEVSAKLHSPAIYTWGNSPLCSLNVRLVGPQSQSGCFGVGEICLAHGRNPALDHAACSLVTVLTELSKLFAVSSNNFNGFDFAAVMYEVNFLIFYVHLHLHLHLYKYISLIQYQSTTAGYETCHKYQYIHIH
jgi:hypothetical protein